MNKSADQNKSIDEVNVSDGSMSQIRELLFGESQRNTDKQLQEKDEQLYALKNNLNKLAMKLITK